MLRELRKSKGKYEGFDLLQIGNDPILPENKYFKSRWVRVISFLN